MAVERWAGEWADEILDRPEQPPERRRYFAPELRPGVGGPHVSVARPDDGPATCPPTPHHPRPGGTCPACIAHMRSGGTME